MSLRCVVIGSNCFTGSHIVDRLLKEGCDVVGISRSPEANNIYLPYKTKIQPRFEFIQADLCLEGPFIEHLLDRLQPDFVINVAALSEVFQSHLTPNEYFSVNSTATVRIANFLRTRKWLKRYIHISSAEVYGACDSPATEEAPLMPTTPYAVSKAAADLYLLTSSRHFGFPSTLVRSTNVYGKHQQLFKIIPRATIFLKLGRVIELHCGGKAIRPFIHIRDVVEGIWRIMCHPNPSTLYNFSTDFDACIADVVKVIADKLKMQFSEVTRSVGQRPAQDSRYWLKSDLAKRELQWEPRESFDLAVDEVIDWIDENWSQIQREPLDYVHKVVVSKPFSEPQIAPVTPSQKIAA